MILKLRWIDNYSIFYGHYFFLLTYLLSLNSVHPPPPNFVNFKRKHWINLISEFYVTCPFKQFIWIYLFFSMMKIYLWILHPYYRFTTIYVRVIKKSIWLCILASIPLKSFQTLNIKKYLLHQRVKWPLLPMNGAKLRSTRTNSR